MAATQCKGCHKFQKKDTVMVDGLCPKCLEAKLAKEKEENAVVENALMVIDDQMVENAAEPVENQIVEIAEVAATVEIPPMEEPAKIINPYDLVKPGKRGVTNFQMIPVMKDAVDTNDIEKLILLKQYFGSVFESTTKYIGKDRKNKLIALKLAI